MPSDVLLMAFEPWMRGIASRIQSEEYDDALDLVNKAEEAIKALDEGNWLRHTCLATRALIHQQRGDATAALELYKEAQTLAPSLSDYMVNQLGIAQALQDGGAPPEAVFQALETGLSVADRSLPTALSLLRMYASVSLRHGTDMPLKWSELYLRSCRALGTKPREFDPQDPHTFTIAVAETH
jgi:hypothetical protein